MITVYELKGKGRSMPDVKISFDSDGKATVEESNPVKGYKIDVKVLNSPFNDCSEKVIISQYHGDIPFAEITREYCLVDQYVEVKRDYTKNS